MVSRLFDPLPAIADLQAAIRGGDWHKADEIARELGRQTPPANAGDLGRLLQQLKETLLLARASREHSAASLTRLSAAARFNRNGCDSAALRRNFAAVTDF
ncbi:MAG: hypothetical protein M3N93_11705 [Acidobacteriota bacterium]|nr:hypothetical protein [Acidobacteriota bacterium]